MLMKKRLMKKRLRPKRPLADVDKHNTPIGSSTCRVLVEYQLWLKPKIVQLYHILIHSSVLDILTKNVCSALAKCWHTLTQNKPPFALLPWKQNTDTASQETYISSPEPRTKQHKMGSTYQNNCTHVMRDNLVTRVDKQWCWPAKTEPAVCRF